MLLLTANRDALLAPLQSVSGIVGKHHGRSKLSFEHCYNFQCFASGYRMGIARIGDWNTYYFPHD